MFYLKLTRELKKQFKTSNIPIPNTRAQCVAVAQRIQEGLYGSDKKRGVIDKSNPTTGTKYPCIGSERDRKDRYHQDYCLRDNRNQDRPRNKPTTIKSEKELICYQYNKPGHYATSYLDYKEHTKAKVQSVKQEDHLSPVASTQPSSRSGLEIPQPISDLGDSNDSLNQDSSPRTQAESL